MLVERLQKQSGLSNKKLVRLAETASVRYKVYTIPKRTGGLRTIAHPSRELKAVQRWINARLINTLDVHNSATAYRKGSNIRSNAARHVATKFTLRADFRDFFPSFNLDQITEFLMIQNIGNQLDLSDGDIDFVSKIVCRHGHLTIGAPTSPSLTNVMMFEFDVSLNNFAEANNLVYTRYADDLFLSAYQPNQLDGAMKEIKRLAREFRFADLTINDKKTAFLSRRYKRSITGVIVTPDGKLSIGRSRKREIKSLIHQFGENALEPERVAYLTGMLAFSSDVEPSFHDAMVLKYGSKLINRIKSNL